MLCILSPAPSALRPNPLTIMPVMVPQGLVGEGLRLARFVIIEGAVLHNGAPMPAESYHISDWVVNARLFLYCGAFTEQDFAAHVCLMMRGEVSRPPCLAPFAQPLATCGSTRPSGWVYPIGFSCWKLGCKRVSRVAAPRPL